MGKAIQKRVLGSGVLRQLGVIEKTLATARTVEEAVAVSRAAIAVAKAAKLMGTARKVVIEADDFFTDTKVRIGEILGPPKGSGGDHKSTIKSLPCVLITKQDAHRCRKVAHYLTKEYRKRYKLWIVRSYRLNRTVP